MYIPYLLNICKNRNWKWPFFIFIVAIVKRIEYRLLWKYESALSRANTGFTSVLMRFFHYQFALFHLGYALLSTVFWMNHTKSNNQRWFMCFSRYKNAIDRGLINWNLTELCLDCTHFSIILLLFGIHLFWDSWAIY